jgi:hypothetical protein
VPDTFNIDLWSTAQVFNTGHQLRVIISSSNYPRFEKNPNTGAPFKRNDSVFVVATQSVYRTPLMPSHLLLPILPGINPAVKEDHRDNLARSSNVTVQSITSNPEIHFCLPRNCNVSLVLYNALGRKVWSFNKSNYISGDHRVRLPQLASGVYFIHSEIGDDMEVQKIVIIK